MAAPGALVEKAVGVGSDVMEAPVVVTTFVSARDREDVDVDWVLWWMEEDVEVAVGSVVVVVVASSRADVDVDEDAESVASAAVWWSLARGRSGI